MVTGNDVGTTTADLSAAKTGTLTTRTTSTAGTLTMTTGHGITDGQRLDIFWSTGACYGATVGTVSTNSVPFTGAQGTVLPIATTAITAQVPTVRTVVVTGNNATAIQAYSTLVTGDGYANIVIAQSDATTIVAYQLSGSLPSTSWDGTGVATNPLAGVSVGKVYYAQGTTSSRSLGSNILYNS